MTQYATRANLAVTGLPSAALIRVNSFAQDETLAAQGAKMDTYLRAQYTLPFAQPFPAELVSCNAVMAAYAILQNHRGFAPADVDDGFRLRYEDCLAWLKDLSTGKAALDGAADATPTINEGRPRVQTGGANRAHGTGDTGESRGW